MLKWLVMLIAVVNLKAQGLGPGPQPGEGEQHQGKKQVRRNLPYPFLPVYIPYQQVVEVHHVVMLQSPNCQPGGGAQLPSYLPPNTGYPQLQPGFPPVLPGYPQVQPQPPVQQPPAQQPPATEAPTAPGILDRMNGKTNDTLPKRPSRYSCFELLGCPGAFWGVNPCESQVVQAAANTALNYYMSGGQDPEANSL